jgi:HEAT repeat protein
METQALAKNLESDDSATRVAAAEELAKLADGAQPAAVSLVKAMGDAEGAVRDWALAALEALGPPAAGDTDALVKFLADARLNIAYWAATLLGRLGEDADAAKVVPVLVQALEKHPDLAVRERAAWALGKIGPNAIDALPALKNVAGDPKLRLSRLAREAIDKIG